MARFDELGPGLIREGPALTRGIREAQDAKEAGELLAQIEGLLDDPRYGFARGTLEGIHDTVSKSLRVTLGQRYAVERIADSKRGHR